MIIEFMTPCSPSDWNILEADAMSLQARIAATFSQDPALVKLFLENGDFHSTNAYNMMAKYQKFEESKLFFADGTNEVHMEWENFDITRKGKELTHISPSDIKPDDIFKGKVVLRNEILKRPLKNYEEYLKNCKSGRLKELRTTAKLFGFGFLFGMSAGAFASSTLRMEWSPEACKEFIEKFDLAGLYKSLAAQNRRASSEDELLYLTVATYFRTEFFKFYPVLEKWIAQCAADATIAGYVKSPFGARRLLPQITYKGQHSDGAEIKNLSNIAVNSPVQNYETVFMSRVMINSRRRFKELGLKSYVLLTVHDSVVVFCYVPERDIVLKILLEEFSANLPEAMGIPYEGECNVAEVSKREVWGLGKREVKLSDVANVEIPKARRQR